MSGSYWSVDPKKVHLWEKTKRDYYLHKWQRFLRQEIYHLGDDRDDHTWMLEAIRQIKTLCGCYQGDPL